MATLTDTTPFEILKSDTGARAGILAELINRHQNAYSELNTHSAEIAEHLKLNPVQETENRKLLARERAAARKFVSRRPKTLAEARAKAAYTVLAGEALTAADREGVLRSLV